MTFRPPSPDARLARLARRQAGAFTTEQARACGMSDAMLRLRVRRGEIAPYDSGVWVLAAATPGWTLDCWTATLVHPVAALSHRSAVAGLDLGIDRSSPVHATVPLDADHRSTRHVVHRSRHHRFAVHDGLRITRVEQVLVQLASTEPELVEGVLHAAVDRRPADLDRILRHLHRLRRSRLPGLRGLAELAAELEGEPPTQSELERALLSVVALVPGMPRIVRQAPAPWSPSSRHVVDALVPEWRLVLEADGRAFHDRRADFERDRWRDAEAAVHGHHVMRFTHRRVRDDADGIVDQLVRFGRHRRAA